MNAVCNLNECYGCKACIAICPKNAITMNDEVEHLNTLIDEDSCINCNLCKKVCINHNKADFQKTVSWQQGWAVDENIRAEASSGGAATAIASSFIEQGGAVCSCHFSEGCFKFKIAKKKSELKHFAGSKYIKSDMGDVYHQIKKELTEGTEVLFIGLPCQVSAVKRFCAACIDNLYTIDLICHGSPSPEILSSFLQEQGIMLNNISEIQFRKKNDFKLYKKNSTSKEFRALEPFQDLYLDAFLSGTIFTENCYSCKYATSKRVGDITLGDSWGSELPADEVERGISLIMCQNAKGIKLLKLSNLHLEGVDSKKAIAANRQLEHPFVKPQERDVFFSCFIKTGSFKKAYFHAFPVKYIKHVIKLILYRAHIYRGG